VTTVSVSAEKESIHQQRLLCCIIFSIMANLSKWIADYIKARPSFLNFFKPVATGYMSLKGHRRIGLRYALLPSISRFSPNPLPIAFSVIAAMQIEQEWPLIRRLQI
jgi:hypothetical protein